METNPNELLDEAPFDELESIKGRAYEIGLETSAKLVRATQEEGGLSQERRDEIYAQAMQKLANL